MEPSIIVNQEISNKILTIDFNQLDMFVDDIFQDSLSQFIDNETQDKNSLAVAYINNLYIDGLVQLRKNKISTYANSRDKISAIINSLPLNENEMKVINVCAIPVKAYYYYKQGEYNKSIAGTNQAIINDDFFLEKYPMLYGHKIQQLHNVMRTFFKSRKIESACRLNDDVLCHLLAGKPINYVIGKWANSYDILENEDMISMVYQIFTETIFTISKFAENKEDENKFLLMAFKNLSNTNLKISKDILLLKKWISFKIIVSQNKEIDKNSLLNWIDKILENRFAIMSKPLFFSLYLDLGGDGFYENKQQFIKKHYS